MAHDRVPREQLDACRPGSHDLDLPELAALRASLAQDASLSEQFERICQFDRQIAAALGDVPVPANLAERILARLQHAQEPSEEPPATLTSLLHVVQAPAAEANRGFARRRLWRWLAAAAVVPLAGWLGWRFWPRGARSVPPHEIAANLDTWLRMVGAPPGPGWRSPQTLPPGSLPPAVHAPPQAWKPFRTRQGWSGVAVELAPPGQPRATLIAVRGPVRFEVPARPYALLATSMNQATAAWASQGTLFVLVVAQGGKTRLDQLIRPSPLA
jgi:hypothetical protein